MVAGEWKLEEPERNQQVLEIKFVPRHDSHHLFCLICGLRADPEKIPSLATANTRQH